MKFDIAVSFQGRGEGSALEASTFDFVLTPSPPPLPAVFFPLRVPLQGCYVGFYGFLVATDMNGNTARIHFTDGIGMRYIKPILFEYKS